MNYWDHEDLKGRRASIDQLARQGSTRWLNPAHCAHANEAPTGESGLYCKCPDNCACRQHMCAPHDPRKTVMSTDNDGEGRNPMHSIGYGRGDDVQRGPAPHYKPIPPAPIPPAVQVPANPRDLQEIVADIVDALEPLTPVEQQRVLRAARVLLGLE